MGNQYYFHDVDKSARKPTEDIMEWLKQWYTVINVEDDKTWRQRDVDLLALQSLDGKFPTCTKLEIKVDKYHGTPNYCCEIISNTSKNSIGCWYQTQSDYIVYYFPNIRELHLINTKQAQEYVKANESKFKNLNVDTTGRNGEYWYSTLNKLVPRKEMQKHVDVKIFKI